MTRSAEALWQPGLDAPLFPTELLDGPTGLAEIEPGLSDRVGEYLTAVVNERGPLHLNVAWNALHYGWDLSQHAYTETLLNTGALATLERDALERTPTGAIVQLWTDIPVWVEVVHVEADDATSDSDGDLPGARSGAPYDADIRLRAVLDAAVFGPVDPDSSRALDRLTRKGVLDAHGHLLAAAAPADADLAEEVAGDPIRSYARWLAADPTRLGGGPIPAALDTTDPTQIAAAVTASLHALLTLVGSHPRLAIVGEHLVLADTPGPLENADVEDIIRQAVRARRRHRRYTAAGVALRDLMTDRRIPRARYVAALTQLNAALIDAALTGPSDRRGTRLRLDDPGRAGGVWRAVGAGEDDPGDGCDPLIALGLGYAENLSTALDHTEAGRDTDTADTSGSPDAAAGAPPGAAPAETRDHTGTDRRSETEAEDRKARAARSDAPGQDDTADEQDQSERGDGLLGDLDVAASHLTYTCALRTRHLTDGTLPVPAAVHDEHLTVIPRALAVRLGHAGEELDDAETFHEPVTAHTSPCQVRDITWPLAFYPGLLLTATLTVGGRILDVSTQRLPNPVEFAGIPLAHATDLTILAAHLGVTPPDEQSQAAAAGDHAEHAAAGTALDGDAPDSVGHGNDDAPAEDDCGTGGPLANMEYGEQDLSDPTNRAFLALLLRTVVRTVEPGDVGVRSFTAPVLVATAFAGLTIPKDAVGRAHRLLDAYAARGRLLRLPGEMKLISITKGWREGPPTYLWWPPGGRAPLHRLPVGIGPVVRRPHWVPITIRNLPHGWEASQEKIATWPAIRASLGPTTLPRELKPGTTWVEAHERGNDPGWQSGAVRRS